MKGRILIAIIVIALIIAGTGALVIYSFQGREGTSTSTSSTSTDVCDSLGNTAVGQATSSNSSSTAVFTIIETDTGAYEGMNGSAYHISTPWPLMVVHKGQTVVIHIYNCASSEPHGFAISHYFDGGVTIQEGQSFTESFVATLLGNFTVYCNVYCAIHPLMQNGRLMVL